MTLSVAVCMAEYSCLFILDNDDDWQILDSHIIIINVVHEVQNKYKHKRKAKRKLKNMTIRPTTSLYAQMFYGRTDVIFATVR